MISEPVSPVNNEVVAVGLPSTYELIKGYTVLLTARDVPASVPGAVIIDQFQIAEDAAFTKRVDAKTVARSAGGQTSTSMTVWSEINQVHYWRVRASAGETIGEYSAPAAFTIGAVPRVPQAGAAPRLVTPADGTRTGGNMVIFRAIIGDHSGPPGGGEFDVATSPAFGQLRARCTFSGADVSGRPVECQIGMLQPGTYYWRAVRMLDGFDIGRASTFVASEIRTLIITNETIDQPRAVPLPASVHNRVTLSVVNPAGVNAVGPFEYRFSLNTIYRSPIVDGTVPEGAGVTSWTVPVDLQPGIVYLWEAYVVDTTTGALSLPAQGSFFIVPQRERIYLFAIEPAASCSKYWSRVPTTIYSEATPNSPVFHFTSQGTFAGDLFNDGGVVRGSFGGDFVRKSASDPGPVAVNGIVDPVTGTISGTFEGYVQSSTSGDAIWCMASGWRFTITPQ